MNMLLIMIWNKNLSMNMNDFLESNINFRFNEESWKIIKYDENIAHKKVDKFVKPTKAVDFLGIHDNKRLYFVEIKNYRRHTQDPKTKDILSAGGEELMRKIAVKVRDTIASMTNAARFCTNDHDFFTQANQLLLNDKEKVVVIALIEFDEESEKERKAKMSIWLQTLKQKLSWLHAAKISINSVDDANAILPEVNIAFV